MPRDLSETKKKVIVPVLFAASSLTVLLLALSFSGKVMAIGPLYQIQWETGEPFSPSGFFYVNKEDVGDRDISEFRMLNGTFASFSFKVMPSTWPPAIETAKFPLNLTLNVGIRDKILGTLPEDVSVTLSQSIVILKSQNDTADLTVTLTTKDNAREATYEMWVRRTLGVGASESGPLPVEIRVLTGHQTTTTTITTITTIISTITTRLGEQPLDTTYAWAVSATVAAAVLAAVLMLQRMRK